MAGSVVLYFVKYPEAGKVKTRLAEAIGLEAAAAAYRRIAERNFEALVPLRGEGIQDAVVFDPQTDESGFRDWLPHAALYIPQRGSGLGERLTNAFAAAFAAGYGRAAALGSDTLDLSRDIVKEAFRALDENDAVIGPARDGGYYLIALSRPMPFLFEDMPWSTPAVFDETISRLRERHLGFHLLQPLEDLDEAKNLRNPEAG